MKNLFNVKILFIYCTAIVFITISGSCKKNGIGGSGSLSGLVKHHAKPIPNAVVYIKYGASEFPGADVSLYDDHSTSNGDAHYEINNLRKGDYYLYGVGFDYSINQKVTGGIGVSLGNKESKSVDVPVTE